MTEYFTVASANAVLGKVNAMYRMAMAAMHEIKRLEGAMQAALMTDSKLKSYVKLKQDLNAKLVEYYNAIEQLEGMGVMVKSLEEGLLDFPAERFGEDIWLCWKVGEDSVKFWHDKHTGFMGRKPIEVSDESLV